MSNEGWGSPAPQEAAANSPVLTAAQGQQPFLRMEKTWGEGWSGLGGGPRSLGKPWGFMGRPAESRACLPPGGLDDSAHPGPGILTEDATWESCLSGCSVAFF